MAMRQAIANRKPIAPNMARRSLSLTEIPETEEVPSHPDNAEITDVDTGLSMYLNEENQDAKSPSLRIPDSNGMMNDDLDPNKSETIAITEKIPSQEPAPTHHRQANNTSRDRSMIEPPNPRGHSLRAQIRLSENLKWKLSLSILTLRIKF